MPLSPPTSRWSTIDPLNLGVAVPTDTQLQSVAGGIAANRAVFMRFLTGGEITTLRWFCQVQSGNYDIALYNGTGTGASRAPSGTKVWSLGSTACPAAGFITVSLGATYFVNPEMWVAFAADNGVIRAGQTSPQVLGSGGYGRTGYADAAFPLPSTAPAMTAGLVTPVFIVGV